jgi:hypothetical protein
MRGSGPEFSMDLNRTVLHGKKTVGVHGPRRVEPANRAVSL